MPVCYNIFNLFSTYQLWRVRKLFRFRLHNYVTKITDKKIRYICKHVVNNIDWTKERLPLHCKMEKQWARRDLNSGYYLPEVEGYQATPRAQKDEKRKILFLIIEEYFLFI